MNTAGARLLGLAATAVVVLASTVSAATGSASLPSDDGALASAPPGSPAVDEATSDRPDWFGLEMTDVRTGETFTIDDFAGKVVLLETMAIWCPTCAHQGDEIRRLHEILGDPADLVSISLDVDMGEDAAMLKAYADALGHDWHFAVAPLLVARALGNLYSAQYLNPPLAPMLVIDRDGNVLGLPYGLKDAESLQGVVEPLLGA